MTRFVAEYLNPHFGYFYTVRESIHRTRTDYQDLEIVETEELGRVMLLDQVTQVATRNDWLYHEPMVHPALTAHPAPRAVCVVGGGDGGIVREALKHGPERVVHAELDGGVVEACRRFMPSVHGGCWDDPRVELVIGDGRRAIEEGDEPFDAVIMDMTDPFGPSTMLYTREFFQAVKRRLRDGDGRFVMHAESPISRPRAYQQILGTLGAVWSHVHVFYVYIEMYAVLWSIAVAGDDDREATIAREELAGRLARRGIDGLQVYTPDTHHAMQAAFPFVTRLRERAGELPVVTDAAPRFEDEIDLNLTAPRLVLQDR